MGEDIDEAAEQLSVVQSGDALEQVPITDVEETATTVELELSLPSGDSFEETLSKPPVWGSNCELKTLLDAFGLGPDSVGDLDSKTVPCERTVTDDGLSFEIDFEVLDAG
jgi:hypothetical protein